MLTPAQDSECYICFSFRGGVVRLGRNFGDHFPDITLGFCGGTEDQWLWLGCDAAYRLEALCECSFVIRYHKQCPVPRDLVAEWLLGLHLVRHPVGSDARLISLLQLLVTRFGTRTATGYELPFLLSHSRMAELIGATRSTVTRQLIALRNDGLLQVSQTKESLLLSPAMLEDCTIPAV